MRVENWRVQLQPLPGRFEKALHIFRKNGDKIEHILPNGEIGTISIGDAVVQPLLVLDEEMLYALSEELSGRGYKPKDLGKVEGLYEAQSEHLDDLRHLLKLPKVPPIITSERKPYER